MIEVCRNCPNLETLNLHSQSTSDDAAVNGVCFVLVAIANVSISGSVSEIKLVEHQL